MSGMFFLGHSVVQGCASDQHLKGEGHNTLFSSSVFEFELDKSNTRTGPALQQTASHAGR